MTLNGLQSHSKVFSSICSIAGLEYFWHHYVPSKSWIFFPGRRQTRTFHCFLVTRVINYPPADSSAMNNPQLKKLSQTGTTVKNGILLRIQAVLIIPSSFIVFLKSRIFSGLAKSRELKKIHSIRWHCLKDHILLLAYESSDIVQVKIYQEWTYKLE